MTSPADPDRHWEQWLVHLLWAVSARTTSLGEGALEGSPLTLPGLGVLENVDAQPGVTIAEIARRAPQTQQALSQVAARLEKLGFLERRLAGRGRGIGLHLTPAGAAALAGAQDAVEAFEAGLADALGSERHDRLVALLSEAREVVVGLERSRDAQVSARRRPLAGGAAQA